MFRKDDTNIAGLEWLEKKSPVKLLATIRYTDKAAESTFLTSQYMTIAHDAEQRRTIRTL